MTRRFLRGLLAVATTTAVFAVTATGFLYVSRLGEQRRCDSLTPHGAAWTRYSCGPQSGDGRSEGEADRPSPTRASRSRVAGPSRTTTPRSRIQTPPTGVRFDSLDWEALAECESGGNAHSTSLSGKYRGMFQFDRTTWANYGLAGDPATASDTEQLRRAKALYRDRGRSPWPICGKLL